MDFVTLASLASSPKTRFGLIEIINLADCRLGVLCLAMSQSLLLEKNFGWR